MAWQGMAWIIRELNNETLMNFNSIEPETLIVQKEIENPFFRKFHFINHSIIDKSESESPVNSENVEKSPESSKHNDYLMQSTRSLLLVGSW